MMMTTDFRLVTEIESSDLMTRMMMMMMMMMMMPWWWLWRCRLNFKFRLFFRHCRTGSAHSRSIPAIFSSFQDFQGLLTYFLLLLLMMMTTRLIMTRIESIDLMMMDHRMMMSTELSSSDLDSVYFRLWVMAATSSSCRFVRMFFSSAELYLII